MKQIGGLLCSSDWVDGALFPWMEFILLQWVDNWGPEVGWGIRIGMAVVGAILFFIGSKRPAGLA